MKTGEFVPTSHDVVRLDYQSMIALGHFAYPIFRKPFHGDLAKEPPKKMSAFVCLRGDYKQNNRAYFSSIRISSEVTTFTIAENSEYSADDYSYTGHWEAVVASRKYFEDNWWQILHDKKGAEWKYLSIS